MARVNLITGSWDGKVGQLVGAKWKDKKTLRAYAKPSNPNTADQQKTRKVFKGMSEYVALFSDSIKQLTSLNTRGMSVRNAVIQANAEQFEGTEFKPQNLIVNKGGLPKFGSFSATAEATKIKMTITKPTATNISDKAISVMVFVDAEKKAALVKTALLVDGTTEIDYTLESTKTGYVYGWIIDYRGSTRVGSPSEVATVTGV